MNYHTVIFDLDGVICHTDHYHYQAWKRIADSLGIEFNQNINNRLRGVSRIDSLEIILEKYEGVLTAEEKERLAAEKNEYYKELLKEMTPDDLSCEVKDTLEELKHRGITLAIGSSSKNTRFILSRLGLADFFDAVSDGNNISRSKPDPEVFLKAAEFAGADPAGCLVVEDARAGVEAAKAAGMDCAAIGDAADCGIADYSMKEFSELKKIVL